MLHRTHIIMFEVLCAPGVLAVHICGEVVVGEGNGVRRGKDQTPSDALNADHH
jgi:hypothetical protein